ncbi:predicted protein, partial [Nematostella vectensis]
MYEIEEVPLVWIELKDETRLAATLWMPSVREDGSEPSNVIFFPEFLPYNRMGWTKIPDNLQYPKLASHGFVGVRVDMRGSGDSEGLYFDEYKRQEQKDCCEVIDWISKQEWSNGSVGMLGMSWGGFNALQVAALQPPALKAIVSVYSSDDRYADDIHYIGGCVMGIGGLAWASKMALWNARPPDPLSVGKRWVEMWKHRLHHSSYPWMNTWLSHQTRDDYWKHASICEDFSQISCPVLLIGGWADLYTNCVFRMAESLTCPLKAIVGPWSHCWPANGVTPGPAIDHVEVMRQWFGCHLKGETNGAMEQPNLRIYMKQVKMPQNLSDMKDWPGEWICEEQWPSTNIVSHLFSLCQKSEKLVRITSTQESRDTTQKTRSIQSDPVCGINGGYNMAGNASDLPTDQSHDDRLSLCWDSYALKHDVSVLGFPEVELELSSDQPQAQIAVRLCDVFPDGSSTLISRGILNLTHREGHGPESVKALEPGKQYTIKIQLDATGHVVQQGNTLRLAVSPSYFPVVWPSPTPTTLNIHYGVLRLP